MPRNSKDFCTKQKQSTSINQKIVTVHNSLPSIFNKHLNITSIEIICENE